MSAVVAMPRAQAASEADATLAWLRDSVIETRTQPAASDAAANTPLGSLWKLYVYAYLVEGNANEPAYTCSASSRGRVDEQEYCCQAGESVTRDRALARSCSAYFEPQRLGITGGKWREYWSQHAPAGAAWLSDLSAMQPHTQVRVDSLLATLDRFPPHARQAAREALAEVTLSGYGRGALAQLGSGPRMKTFTWRRLDRPDTYYGGAAGWLADGTPFWIGATGSSQAVLTRHAPWLQASLPLARTTQTEQACVIVDFFARYPIASVASARGERVKQSTRLDGKYVVTFKSGSVFDIQSNGELELRIEDELQIQGRLNLEDYVARVIDREADANATEAARALAVLARTYLLQNARFEAACYRISDSSSTQRVRAAPPTRAAVEAAQFTAGLHLTGTPVRYHRDRAAPGQFAWLDAVAQAKAGASFDTLLARTFPQAALATSSGVQECRRLNAAERWLAAALPQWQRLLAMEPGFEPMQQAPAVCALNYGHPYSDQQRLRIYVRGWRSLNDQIALAHEFLHLAFRFHPRGFDEAFIEDTARRLIQG